MIIQGQSQKPDPIDVVETVKLKDPSYRISNHPTKQQSGGAGIRSGWIHCSLV